MNLWQIQKWRKLIPSIQVFSRFILIPKTERSKGRSKKEEIIERSEEEKEEVLSHEHRKKWRRRSN